MRWVLIALSLCLAGPAAAQEWLSSCRVEVLDDTDLEDAAARWQVEVTEGRVTRLRRAGGGWDSITPLAPVPHRAGGSYGFLMQTPRGSRDATDWSFRLVTMEPGGTILVETFLGRLWTEMRLISPVRLRCS
ncbi:hypothetical protein ACE7GA_04790 [Roseomonas sp. CCTCC AB2023176]|uniref:hypothetical protein n=1 Tax=Roseomonas sp. CCTCC AB2023176 TaxID=3342640 RepID=UPI0035D66A02